MSDESKSTTAQRICSWFVTRRALKRLFLFQLVLVVLSVWAYFTMIRMPGESYRGPLPPLTEAQGSLAESLQNDVEMLAGTIGRRSVFFPDGLDASVEYLAERLNKLGYEVLKQEFQVQGVTCVNIEVELTGDSRPDEIIVVGAHYDSVDMSPAANDNASGVAATLALARSFSAEGRNSARTIRFVFFVNEEPPFFHTDAMGSWVYAKRCRERNEKITAMLSLETIGYYSDQQGSQHYPALPLKWVYPTSGNFIAFVSNVNSRKLLRQVVGSFRANVQFPSEGAALPGWIAGVGWSDHWAFWQEGYPAIMVTDTAPFRYPYYHTLEDTPDKLDYERMARVVEGVERVVTEIANSTVEK